MPGASARCHPACTAFGAKIARHVANDLLDGAGSAAFGALVGWLRRRWDVDGHSRSESPRSLKERYDHARWRTSAGSECVHVDVSGRGGSTCRAPRVGPSASPSCSRRTAPAGGLTGRRSPSSEPGHPALPCHEALRPPAPALPAALASLPRPRGRLREPRAGAGATMDAPFTAGRHAAIPHHCGASPRLNRG